MPTPTRPTNTPAWTQGNTAQQTEPTNSEKFSGYSSNQRPSPKKLNWLLGNVSDWIDWFDYKIQAGIAALQGYDWVVGVGGTHATINALIADSNVVDGNSILVTSPQTLTTTQVITKSGLDFYFKPSAVYSKGLSTTPGISIQGQRIRIMGGRFTSFNGGSDKAIQIESGFKNNWVMNASFVGNTTDISDLGSNNVLANNISEL